LVIDFALGRAGGITGITIGTAVVFETITGFDVGEDVRIKGDCVEGIAMDAGEDVRIKGDRVEGRAMDAGEDVRNKGDRVDGIDMLIRFTDAS
jgi:hypothetical protein